MTSPDVMYVDKFLGPTILPDTIFRRHNVGSIFMEGHEYDQVHFKCYVSTGVIEMTMHNTSIYSSELAGPYSSWFASHKHTVEEINCVIDKFLESFRAGEVPSVMAGMMWGQSGLYPNVTV